jgi:hypothetical protein
MNNLVAWLIGLAIVAVIYHFVGSQIFGGAPRLTIRAGRHGVNPKDGSEWQHLEVRNIGLWGANWKVWRVPLSRSTRPAIDAVISARYDNETEDSILHWGSTRGPVEATSIHRGRPREIPIVVRNRNGFEYGWRMQPDGYYISDCVFLTQGPGDRRDLEAERPLSPGSHRLRVTIYYGRMTTERFSIVIPHVSHGQASVVHLPWEWFDLRD